MEEMQLLKRHHMTFTRTHKVYTLVSKPQPMEHGQDFMRYRQTPTLHFFTQLSQHQLAQYHTSGMKIDYTRRHPTLSQTKSLASQVQVYSELFAQWAQ